MASKYDNINSAEDLVREVSIHGLSADLDDICRAQDIFGHSSIEELARLANDNGRVDSKGNPDPNGSWSSGRRGTHDTFYMILFHIWNWEDAIRFWNEHSNPGTARIAEVERENVRLTKSVETANAQAKQEHEMRLQETRLKVEYAEKASNLNAELRDRNMKIMELKARLFDIMDKEAK